MLLLAGCYSAPVMPPGGLLYADLTAPIDTNAEGGSMGSRVGQATSNGYFGLIATGDCSVAAACEDGGITRIDHIDYRYENMLGLQKFTITVIGD
jgi:TRL-like protein family